MKLDSIRREYKFAELTRKSIDKNPFKQFTIWLNDALNSKVNEPTAMSAISIGTDGFPQSRIVLLKGYNQNGFTFFTDYSSEKGKAIEKNNSIGIHFFWPELERQIRISGYAEKTSISVSDSYFQSRPITSQIAAIVSNQSEEIPNRQFLENRFFDLQDKLHGEIPERPKSWGGYIVKPVKIEFWQGRESRLHDRILYEKKDEPWVTKRLAP
ncbi:MAG: pyridoxamine 5'-phosphate oxidase [Bacteroidetes bacterium]|nr:pyridoxamine 5'-phosphate oxidase [Bacteroidota bacterium]